MAGMPAFICVTCGTQYPASNAPSDRCLICEDERQYVGLDGQRWTTLDDLRRDYRNRTAPVEPGLTSILMEPAFAVGERAFLIESAGGNVLWDCVALIDDATISAIRGRGGWTAIAISPPRYYTTMVEWSTTFGGVPIYLHADDRQWVIRNDAAVRYWSGEQMTLDDGMMLVRGGGHFAGGSMLHWPAGAEGRGVLFSGDIIQVGPDRKSVSFMWSYPNYIPLDGETVLRVARSVEPFKFDRIHGAFDRRSIDSGAKAVVARSVDRYLRAVEYGD